MQTRRHVANKTEANNLNDVNHVVMDALRVELPFFLLFPSQSLQTYGSNTLTRAIDIVAQLAAINLNVDDIQDVTNLTGRHSFRVVHTP